MSKILSPEKLKAMSDEVKRYDYNKQPTKKFKRYTKALIEHEDALEMREQYELKLALDKATKERLERRKGFKKLSSMLKHQ